MMKTILLCLSMTMSCWAILGDANGSLLDKEVLQFLSENGHHFVDIFYDPFAMKRHGAFKTKNIFYSKISLATEKKNNKMYLVFTFMMIQLQI